MINAIGPSLVWCAVQVTLFSTVAALVYLAARRRLLEAFENRND